MEMQLEMNHFNVDAFIRRQGDIPAPSAESVNQLIHLARCVIFPGYFDQARSETETTQNYHAQKVNELMDALISQIALTMQHECIQQGWACSKCMEKAYQPSLEFMHSLPELSSVLTKDVYAALQGDPAAKSFDEVIISYPGMYAITVYRLAHILHHLDVPLMPRMMTEHAHSLTGIDIHPGAEIGESFFMDHGTGIVIGETTQIGERVRIYQGVTLGALSLPRNAGENYRNRKRHPTIEDDVIVYANATILGGETVIGARSIIGGNVWLTESVPPDTKVLMKRPELVYEENNRR